MTDAYTVIHVTQSEFQKFVGENTGGIGETKERMIGEYSPQTHSSGV